MPPIPGPTTSPPRYTDRLTPDMALYAAERGLPQTALGAINSAVPPAALPPSVQPFAAVPQPMSGPNTPWLPPNINIDRHRASMPMSAFDSVFASLPRTQSLPPVQVASTQNIPDISVNGMSQYPEPLPSPSRPMVAPGMRPPMPMARPVQNVVAQAVRQQPRPDNSARMYEARNAMAQARARANATKPQYQGSTDWFNSVTRA